jgi:transposase
MAKELVTEELWFKIEPLLPIDPPRPKGGRPRVPNRVALRGILFVLKSGIPWEMLPQEMGCGSGMTCWRRLRDWQKANVWQRLHEILLADLHANNRLDWSRAVVDSGSIRAMCGGKKLERIPLTELNRAANTTSSRMRKAFRFPFSSPARTAMMSPS